MPLDAAILHLECLDPSKSAARETLTNTIGVNYYGHQIRTHVHVATGTPRSSDELARTSAYYGGGPGTLIEGEIIDMAPTGHRHTSVVSGLHDLFARELAGHALVWDQGTLRLSASSAPQPDLVLLEASERPGLTGLSAFQ